MGRSNDRKYTERTMSDFQNCCFTVREAAEYLRISRAMLYKLIHAKQIVPVKIGERTIFRGAELARFLNAAEAA
jgi:excisionase family DNA binding protein